MDQSSENRPRREHLSGHGTISGFALLNGLGVTCVETPTDRDSPFESLDAPEEELTFQV